MPRGVSLLDEARIQGRLWAPGGVVNILGSSHDLSASPWGTFINATGNITLTPNSGLAPDRSNTALLVLIDRSGSSAYAQIYQSITTTAASYVFPIWIRAYSSADVGKLVSLAMYSGISFDLRGMINHPLTEYWQRPCPTAVMPATASAQCNIGYLDATGTSATSQTGQVQFLVWAAACAPGTKAVPIRETTTAGVTTPTAGALEMTKGEAYDLWKHGRQNLLGAGHPYRNRPPMIGP